MSEAWIDLECPNCGANWTANPSELPAPNATFSCPDCDGESHTSEFTQSARDLEVLSEFHDT